MNDRRLAELFEEKLLWSAENPEPGQMPEGWTHLYDGHLLQLVLVELDGDDAVQRFSLMIDGEPMGDLEELPSGWSIE